MMHPNSAAMTPKNRRMTLSNLPPPGQSMHRNHQPAEPGPSAAPGIPKSNARRPPKGRVSMIPRMNGRENMLPPSSSSAVVSTPRGAAIGASSRRRSIGGDELSSRVSSSIRNNRRQSIAPPVNDGSSVATTVNTHNSSSASSHGQKVDPRPINDKVFQQTCIRELLAFLHEKGYNYPVSMKSLARPSAKDFSNIVTFMLREVDHDFQREGMKFEDEVVLNFKQLGYPFPISKTALVAAGSLHTWPTLLAALSWLMNQIQIKKEHFHPNYLANTTEATFETLPDLDKQTECAFFQYMHRSYVAFMLGNEVDLNYLETAFVQKFEHDDKFLEDAVERVTDENASLVQDINEISQQFEELTLRAQKREAYEHELETFHDLVRQMDERKTTLEQNVREFTAQLGEKNGKIEKLSTHVNELKQAIKEQEFSVDDIHKLEGELKGLSEACDRAYAKRDQFRKAILSSEAELVAVCNDLDTLTAEYNGLIAELQLVPEMGAKFSRMKAEVFKDNLLDEDRSKILGVDLPGKVQVTAVASKAEMSETVGASKTNNQEIVQEMNRVDDGCKEAEAKLKIVSDKRAKSEHVLETERKTLDSKLAVHEREVKAMETKIAALQDPIALEEQMAGFQRQCAELEALRMERAAEHVNQFRAHESEVEACLHLMAKHAAYSRGKVAQTEEYCRAKAEQIGDVVPPANVELDAL